MGTLVWFDTDEDFQNSLNFPAKELVPNQNLSPSGMIQRPSDGRKGRIISVYPRRKSRVTPEIVASILEVCLEKTRKTMIMYKASLTTRSLHRYLESLVSLGLLEKTDSYWTTEKGRDYLELYRRMQDLLEEFNPLLPAIEPRSISCGTNERPGRNLYA